MTRDQFNIELSVCALRIKRIDALLALHHPSEEAHVRLTKRRDEWVAYRAALDQAQRQHPQLRMFWCGAEEI